MSAALVVALVLLLAAVVFPVLALRFKPRASTATTRDDDYAELKASILFLNTALPTLLFLLGALGFASYDGIVKTVSTAAKKDYDEYFNKQAITGLENEIRLLRDSSRAFNESIKALHRKTMTQTAGADSLLQLARLKTNDALAVFMQFLPRGAIIPYRGTSYNFDRSIWALCDGSNGTPDLRDRFVLGAAFENVGDVGGTRMHNHTVRLDIDGVVTKKITEDYTRFNGTATATAGKFKTEKHEHVFNVTRQKATITGENHLPPYHRLVYLMKIK